MDSTQMAKQMIGFQKTVLDNSFSTLSLAQEQTEKTISGYLDQLPWVTDEGKKQMQEVFAVTKKARDDFKKAIDEGFAKLEDLLTQK